MGVIDYPVNPTDEDIVAWAYDDAAPQPIQDWRIVITKSVQGDLLLSLASAPMCPKFGFFLDCLYLLSGDVVRVRRPNQTAADQAVVGLLRLIALGEASSRDWIRRWATRSRALLDDPARFDYDGWCDQGIVLKELEGGLEDEVRRVRASIEGA
jgi:hypothetical protein